MSALAMSSAVNQFGLVQTNYDDTAVSSDAERLRASREEYFKHLSETQTYAKEKCLSESLRDELFALMQDHSIDNWDGDGAKKIDWETINVAYDFLNVLPKNINYPDLDVSYDGDISFEWYASTKRIVTVRINKRSELVFAAMFGEYRNYGSLFFNKKLPSELLSLIKKV